MIRFLNTLFIAASLVISSKAHAFSLAGPMPPWMLEAIPSSAACYTSSTGTGPMNIDEEYRFNVPIVTYGVTSDFASFFGARGVEEIQKAIAVLDSLPNVDQLNVDDYPTQSYRVNHRARALGLVDLKSVALQRTLGSLGLDDPTLYTYAPRNAWIQNGVVLQYYLTVRNFDPVTFLQSPYVNGTLYTYNRQGCPVVFPVDPSERLFATTTPTAAFGAAGVEFQTGVYVTGLTRDDVGGLKYLYHTKNYNMETALPDVAGPGGAIGTGAVGGGGIYDYSGFPGGSGGGVYDSAVIATNALATVTTGNAGAGGGVGGVGAGAGTFVNPAVRGGIGELDFVEAHYDSLLGEFFTPMSVDFSDSYVTNGVRRSQRLVRNLTQPDFVYDARDLQGAFGQDPVIYITTDQNNVNWINSDTFDGTQGDDDGPGIIGGSVLIFNTITPFFSGTVDATGSFLENGHFGSVSGHMWGAFDGTTNDPVVFPQGANLDDLETLIFSR